MTDVPAKASVEGEGAGEGADRAVSRAGASASAASPGSRQLPELDIDFVRSRFPAFGELELQNQAHFENAGGSYACAAVVDRLNRFYRQRKVQPYGRFGASKLAGEEMDEARERVAAMLGVEPDETNFGPSTSQNAYVLAQAFRQAMSPGEAIVVTDQDHEANSGPWRRLSEDGIEIREWRIDPGTGHLDPASLAELLDSSVRLVCFPHCSNVVGEINPVAEIAAMVRAAGALSCVDGVSYAPHGFPDVGRLGADIYMFSAYKTYGPHQGIMTIRREVAEALPNQGHFFNGDSPVKRLVPAGPDHAQVAACAGMADYVDEIAARHGIDAPPRERAAIVSGMMRARESALLGPLMDALKGRNAIRIPGPSRAEDRAPTLSLALEGDRSGDSHATALDSMVAALAERGIMAASGNFYAPRALQAMGIDSDPGVLRLSFVHYTHEDEIASLINALDDFL